MMDTVGIFLSHKFCVVFYMELIWKHNKRIQFIKKKKKIYIYIYIYMEAVQVVSVVCLHRFIKPVTAGIVCSHIYVYVFVQWKDCVILKLFLLVSFK